MKKLLLICFMCACAFAITGQKSDEIVATDISSANLLTKVLNTDNAPLRIDLNPENDPLMRWGGDKVIYAGNIAYDIWAGNNQEQISVDHGRGDTLRAAVACADSFVRIFMSPDNGFTWSYVAAFGYQDCEIYEPEIINGPNGNFHVFSRERRTVSYGAGVAVDNYPAGGGHDYAWIAWSADTVGDYSACSDRSQYPSSYYLYCAWHTGLGGAGADEITFMRSLDFGANWEAAHNYVNGSQLPDLAFGDNSTLYLTRLWAASNDTNYIRLSVNDDRGSTTGWGSSATIYADVNAKLGPQIAASHDGSGDAWVVFSEENSTDPYCYDLLWSWTNDYGATWSNAWYYDEASINGENEILPSLAVVDNAGNDTPYLSYYKADDAWNNPAIYSTNWSWSDSSWYQPESTYNDSVPGRVRPVQTFDYVGGPAIAYVDENYTHVYFDTWTNSPGVEEGNSTNNTLLLGQNRPNPFTTTTNFAYSLATSGPVMISVYDVSGQKVATLVNADKLAGTYAITWQGKNDRGIALPKGVYFLKLETNKGDATRKVVID